MASSTITFYPVGEKNGGMVLIKLNDEKNTTILIDSSIGEDLIADHCDVNRELRDALPIKNNRPYIDAFILTHRHEDHVKGFIKNFHLGSLDDYDDSAEDDDKKIVINEIWSSHNFWKPVSTNYSLCEDAKAFNKEFKRRVQLFKDNDHQIQKIGDKAIIIGTDPDGRTEELSKINYKVGDSFSKINSRNLTNKLEGIILSPIEKQDEETDEEFIFDKNRQSIVIQLNIKQNNYTNKILVAADAECLVWDKLYQSNSTNLSKLKYDILIAPHHCSWHSISYDSLSQDDDPQICENAKKALSNAKDGAFIVSQSKIIAEKDQDPPSKKAKEFYVSVVGSKKFLCTNESPSKSKPEPIIFNLTSYGPQQKAIRKKANVSDASTKSSNESYGHG